MADNGHGVRQTPFMDERIPGALRRLAVKWVKLRGIANGSLADAGPCD